MNNSSIDLKRKKLLEVCKKAAVRIPGSGADQWEIFAASGIENDIEVFNGKIETLAFSDSAGLGIRIFKNHSIGYAYTAVLEDNAIDDAIGKAIANSHITKKDPLNFLPTEKDYKYKVNKADSGKLFNDDFLKYTIDQKIAMALELESLTRKADKRITGISDAMYNDGISEVCMLNSNGFEGNYNSATAMVYISAISRRGEDISTGDYFGIARDPAKLDLKEIAENAAKRSVSILGGKKISSARMDIILDPMVAAQFMGVIASVLNADSVQKGKSLLKDKIGEKIFEIDIDIYDDGTLKEGLASKPFDGEGVIKGKTAIFKEGILKTFLYDVYTARKDGTLSTGNASRASYRSTPSVGVSNFYISPGIHDRLDMIKQVDKGFYIMDIIGLGSGTNPISGQMSVGAKGIMIEKGKLTHPVKEVTIATDILKFLSGFRKIGNDLKFVPSGGYMGSPSILIENIAISGK